MTGRASFRVQASHGLGLKMGIISREELQKSFRHLIGDWKNANWKFGLWADPDRRLIEISELYRGPIVPRS